MRTIEEIIKEIKISIDFMPVCTDKESRAYLEGGIDALKWSLKYDLALLDKPVEKPENIQEPNPDYRFI